MTEVDYGGGAPHTAKTIVNLCVYGVPPSLVYKGVEEGRADPLYGTPQGGILLLVGVGSPPSLVGVGEEGRGRRREGKGGPALHPIRIGLGGAPSTFSLPLLYSTKAQ